MKIYFAGAIRGGRDDRELYLEIIKQLGDYGQVVTEHVGDAWLTALGEEGDDRTIHDRDLSWLKECDCLVAEVTMPSLGVGYEIGKVTEWRKPTLCLYRPSNERTLSAMIAGSSRIELKEYQTVAELKTIFDQFFRNRREN